MQNRIKLWLLRVTAVFCACLSLFSAVMTGTYAWQSEQFVTNDLWGEADTMIPVVLTKLEMTVDGKRTENPIAGAVFYLYKEDGTQIGVRYVTDENGQISVQLTPGRYYFEEVVPPLGYTYPLDEYGEAATRFSFTVEEQAEPYEPVDLTVYNRRLSGDLVISKVAMNSDGTPLSDAQRDMQFTFTVTFSDGGTYPYSINNGEEQTVTSGGTLLLRSGEIAVFEDLPAGVLYNVVETPMERYVSTGTGHQGNIREGETALASFLNTCTGGNTGTLVITKEVRGEGADPEQEFPFSLTLGEVTEEFTLKNGGSKSFRDIPVGTNYIVRELAEEDSDYTALTDTYSGTMAAAEAIYLPFTNVYTPEAPAETGTLVVKKTVTGNTVEPEKRFTIAVTFQSEEPVEKPEDKVFILAAGESATIEGIPHGVTYIVMETDAAGYLPAWDAMKGTSVGGETAEIEVVNAVPGEEPPENLETVKITVSKTLTGTLLSSDLERTFQMTLYVDGEELPYSVALKDGESYTFTVPYGASYELREDDYIAEGFAQHITNGSGIATENTDIVVTNTYVGVPRVEISGKKTWVIPEGMSVALPESITVQLMDGTTVVEEKEIFPDENKDWLYTFTAPKYRADGVTEIEYAIMETPVAQFHMGYDPLNRYHLINTYITPIIDNDPPVIIKEVRGVDAPVAGFTFVFTGKHGTPMPEGSTGYQKEILLNGSGEAEIGAITFTNAGTYVYTIHEKHGGEKGWTYDTALYTITYEVTEDPDTHQLSAARTITRNDRGVEELRFVNSYTAEDWEMVVISGVKTWVHRNNPVAKRPISVIIEVYGDGKLAYMKSLTAEDGWRYSVELPKFADDGHTIVYTVDEQPVNGYRKSISGYDITNTYQATTLTPDDPSIPDPPVDPDVPERPDSSAPTGDNSRTPFWFMMTLASMLGSITALCVLRGNRYEGKRVHVAKHLEKK